MMLWRTWIAVLWFMLPLCCDKLQATLQCFKGNQVAASPVLGEANIVCNENSIQMSWFFEIPNERYRVYQIEYQCYQGQKYNLSDNVIIKDFYGNITSPVSISSINGTKCTIFACGMLADRGYKVSWLKRTDCQLNATTDKVKSSVTLFPPLSHITLLPSKTVYSSSLITIYTTTKSVDVTKAFGVGTGQSIFLFQNLAADIISFVGIGFLSMLIGLFALIMCIYCVKRRRRRIARGQHGEFLQGIQIVRSDSNFSLKTELACPVLNHIDSCEQHKKSQDSECVSNSSQKSSPTLLPIVMPSLGFAFNDREAPYIHDVQYVIVDSSNESGLADTESSKSSSGYVGDVREPVTVSADFFDELFYNYT